MLVPMTTTANTRYTKVAGIHVAYQTLGSGPPDLLVIPDGLVPMQSAFEEPSFERFLRRLAASSRLVCFDRRGLGLSDAVGQAPTLEDWVADAAGVLDAVGSERAAVMGMAEGGFVAALLAAMWPTRVSHLILVNATAGYTAEPFRAWGRAAPAIELLESTIEVDWGDVDFGIPLFAPSAVDDPRYREWLKGAHRRALSPAAAAALFDVLYRSDIRDVLPLVQAPTLVLHRRENRYLTTEHGRYLAGQIPDARYVEVEGADHVPYLGDQAPLLAEIEEFLTGSRRGVQGDRFLATVLFTDIVGSTERVAALGDRAWRLLLEDHNAVVRRALAEHGGREVDTAGDGFLAVFDGPAAAIRCALAIRDDVRGLGLEIRAGVHSGECELVEGKVRGITVHAGARLASLAAAGEVVVSSTTRDLTAGSGIAFEDKGAHELRGVPGEWRVFAVSEA
jgi:class 3 adenylate cyclase